MAYLDDEIACNLSALGYFGGDPAHTLIDILQENDGRAKVHFDSIHFTEGK